MLKEARFSRGDQLSRHLSCKEQRRNKTHGRNIKSTKSGHVTITVAAGSAGEKVSRCENRGWSHKKEGRRAAGFADSNNSYRSCCAWAVLQTDAGKGHMKHMKHTHTDGRTERRTQSSPFQQTPQSGNQREKLFITTLYSHKEMISILMPFSLFGKPSPKFE